MATNSPKQNSYDKTEETISLAFGLRNEGDFEAAKLLFLDAISQLTPKDDSYLICLAELAELEEKSENWLNAIRMHLHLLVELESKLGERDELTLSIMRKTAVLLERIGRPEQAATLYERARFLRLRTLEMPEFVPTEKFWQVFENAYKDQLSPELFVVDTVAAQELKHQLRGQKQRIESFESPRKVPKISDETRKKIAVSMFIVGPLTVALLLGGLTQMHGSGNKADFYANNAHLYQSFTGQKKLSLVDEKKCLLSTPEKENNCTWKFYAGSGADLLAIVFSPIIENQFWITHLPTCCTTERGAVLYAGTAAETQTLKAMQDLLQGAATFYQQTKSYPEIYPALEEVLHQEGQQPLSFKNQSGAEYKPKIRYVHFNGTEQAEGEAWKKDILQRVRSGQLLEGEEAFTAGEVRGYAISINLSIGNTHLFLVRGAGSDGKLLAGNEQGQYAFYGQENGDDMPPEPVAAFFQNSGGKPNTVWILQGAVSPMVQSLLRQSALWSCALASLYLLAASVLMTGKGPLRIGGFVTAIIFAVLAGLYYMTPTLP